jgi:4-diphosphocytidyl-2-C-methyl-D-erythritol kinase
MNVLDIFAPAKLNLSLAVLGRREDGYHELETIMHQIGLSDVVHLRLRPDPGVKVHTTHPELADDETNLAWRAAALLLAEADCGGGVDILIEKITPLGAGLAGGSSDAAAVLVGLNRLLGLPLPHQELLGLGLRVGSDVPICISGKTCLARGRGEILTPVRAKGTPYFVLVGLPEVVSTAEVYRRWDQSGGTEQPDVENIMTALERGDWLKVSSFLYNGLEEVTTAMYPQIGRVKRELLDLGAMGALMSGSGPTVFGVFEGWEDARKAAASLKKKHASCFLTMSCGPC